MTTRSPRLIYFIVGVIGGLAAGAGAMATWMTVEMGGEVVRKGVDTPAGQVALALGLAVIVLALITRKGSTEEPRRWPVVIVLVAGIVLTAIGALASARAEVIYNDHRQATAEKIAEAFHSKGINATTQQVLEQMDQAEAVTIGAGPPILLGGGLAVMLASGAGLLWQAAWKREGEPNDPIGLPVEPGP